MQGDTKPEGNKLDLIFNIHHPLHDHQGLSNQYFEFGNVYLGGKEAVADQFVYQNSIGAILTVMDKKSYEKEKLADRVASLGLTQRHLFLDLKDNKDVKIQQCFPQVREFIEGALERKENVLVHCKGGMSRSPAILCSYLMRKYGLTFDQAYEILKQRRPVVGINQGFQKELREYEKSIPK